MQPTLTAYPVNAISVSRPLFSARSQSRNPQAINMSKHHGALSWNSGLGKVMNEINYSTVGRRNSLELSTNTLLCFLEINMETFRQAGRQAWAGAHRQQGALHPVHMPGDGLGETDTLLVPASPCTREHKEAAAAHGEPLSLAFIERIPLRFRSVWK